MPLVSAILNFKKEYKVDPLDFFLYSALIPFVSKVVPFAIAILGLNVNYPILSITFLSTLVSTSLHSQLGQLHRRFFSDFDTSADPIFLFTRFWYSCVDNWPKTVVERTRTALEVLDLELTRHLNIHTSDREHVPLEVIRMVISFLQNSVVFDWLKEEEQGDNDRPISTALFNSIVNRTEGRYGGVKRLLQDQLGYENNSRVCTISALTNVLFDYCEDGNVRVKPDVINVYRGIQLVNHSNRNPGSDRRGPPTLSQRNYKNHQQPDRGRGFERNRGEKFQSKSSGPSKYCKWHHLEGHTLDECKVFSRFKEQHGESKAQEELSRRKSFHNKPSDSKDRPLSKDSKSSHPQVRCRSCNELGHKAFDCPKRRKTEVSDDKIPSGFPNRTSQNQSKSSNGPQPTLFTQFNTGDRTSSDLASKAAHAILSSLADRSNFITGPDLAQDEIASPVPSIEIAHAVFRDDFGSTVRLIAGLDTCATSNLISSAVLDKLLKNGISVKRSIPDSTDSPLLTPAGPLDTTGSVTLEFILEWNRSFKLVSLLFDVFNDPRLFPVIIGRPALTSLGFKLTWEEIDTSNAPVGNPAVGLVRNCVIAASTPLDGSYVFSDNVVTTTAIEMLNSNSLPSTQRLEECRAFLQKDFDVKTKTGLAAVYSEI